jgi:hypothetical protein
MRSLSHTQNTNYNSKQNAKEKKFSSTLDYYRVDATSHFVLTSTRTT